MTKSDYKKKIVDNWFSFLQTQICKEFESLEGGRKKFTKRNWYKKNKNEGGGTSNLLLNRLNNDNFPILFEGIHSTSSFYSLFKNNSERKLFSNPKD